jgi:hypothetical protein
VSRIRRRVAGGQNATPGAADGYQPIGQGNASPPAVQVMPVSRVIIGPVTSPYVSLGVEDLTPVWTTDGAPVPASAPGRWGQLRAAGRP